MVVAPIVLFIGDDVSSTQIAEGLLHRLMGNRVEIHTAGAQHSNPAAAKTRCW